MAAQTKKQQLKEIEYQTRMLNNLKKWIRNLIILSSCGMGIAYWGRIDVQYYRWCQYRSCNCLRDWLCSHWTSLKAGTGKRE
jgi:hypothetical protein